MTAPSRSLASSPGALAMLSFCAALVGCGSILDVDRFRAVEIDAAIDSGAADAQFDDDGDTSDPGDSAADAADADAAPLDAAYESKISGFTYASSACGACVDAICGDQMAECVGQTSCKPYTRCLAECDDGPSCLHKCFLQVINGYATPAYDVLSCIDKGCAEECGLAARGPGGESCGLTTLSAKCQSCCCEETRRCFENPACSHSLDCPTCNRLDPTYSFDSCVLDCVGEVPDEQSDWMARREALGACAGTGSRCTTACAPEDEWECAGHVEWAGTPVQGLTLSIGVTDFATNAGLFPNIPVEICLPNTNCVPPLDSTTTDARGIAEFEVSPLLFMDVVSYFFRFPKVSGDDYYPIVVMPFYPYAHSEVTTYPIVTREFTDGFGDLMVTRDPSLGIIGFGVFTCTLAAPISSVMRVALREPQPKATIMGTIDGSFSGDLTDAVGFIYNVQPGPVILDYYLVRDDSETFVGSASAIVRAGEVTAVGLFPSPR